MNKIAILILAGLCCHALGKPIPAQKLFSDPDIFSMKISPDGELLLGHVDINNVEFLYLARRDLSNGVKLMRVGSQRNHALDEYDWVDSNTIYFKSRKIARLRNDIIVTGTSIGVIDIDPKQEYYAPKISKFSVTGDLISSLPDEEDRVIFQIKKGRYKDKVRVYTTSVRSLISGDIPGEDKFGHQLNNGLAYVADNHNQVRFSARIEDDDIAFYFLDRQNEWQKLYMLTDRKLTFRPIDFIDDNTLAVLTNEVTDTISVVKYDIRTRTFGDVLYSHEKYDLEAAGLNNAGDLAFVRYIAFGKPVTEYFNAADAHRNASLSKAFKHQQFGVINDNTSTGRQLLYVHSSDDPGSYVLFDQHSLVADYLFNAYGALADYRFTPTQTLQVNTSDNTTIEAMLTQPKVSNGVLLVMPHGGPVGIRDYNIFSPINQYFASRGYAILQVNFRGSTGFGKSFMDSGRGQFGEQIERDISAAVHQVTRMHKYQHTCSIGGSYGGYSALMLAALHPKQYDCAIGMFGVYDLNLLFNESNFKTDEAYRETVKEVVGDDKASFRQRSPVYQAEKITQPVLLIAGRDDDIAPFEHTNRMKYALAAAGNKPETLFYLDVRHGHDRYDAQWHQYAYINDFLERHLQIQKNPKLYDRETKLNELMLIGDGFEFDNIVPNDVELAHGYYKRAADLGSSRAQFNYGVHFREGHGVKQDFDRAVDWFRKASKAGFAKSSLTLGEIYASTELGEKDYTKATDYLNLAVEQNANEAHALLADIYLQSDNPARNVSKAVSHLQELEDAGAYTDQLVSALSSLIEQYSFNGEEKQTADDYLKRTYEAQMPHPGGSELKALGKFNVERSLDLVSKHAWVYLKPGESMGVALHLANAESQVPLYKASQHRKKNRGVNTLLKVNWTHPALQNPETGEVQTETNTLAFGFVKTDTVMVYDFDQEWKKVPGNWKLEVRNLDDELLYSQSFKVEWKD